jgi:hypothetical protein
MSQLALDDQLDVQKILPPLQGLFNAIRIQQLRPGERVLDERIPELLLRLNRPTFLTIDHWFWKRRLCHAGYCIVHFAVDAEKQEQIPELLRRLLRLDAFRTRAERMGKVARVTNDRVLYWEYGRRLTMPLPASRSSGQTKRTSQ